MTTTEPEHPDENTGGPTRLTRRRLMSGAGAVGAGPAVPATGDIATRSAKRWRPRRARRHMMGYMWQIDGHAYQTAHPLHRHHPGPGPPATDCVCGFSTRPRCTTQSTCTANVLSCLT